MMWWRGKYMMTETERDDWKGNNEGLEDQHEG